MFKLKQEYWHLQLFLWKEGLDLNKDVSIAVIKTLIYGNSCSAPVSEEGMAQITDRVSPEDPELATFLTDARFVDDLNDSLKDIKSVLRLKSAVDEAFSKSGAKIKGWAISGQEPAQEISEDGLVGVAGNAWHPMTDLVELKLQPLHFGCVVRGRLAPCTKTFVGNTTSSSDMDEFVPRKTNKDADH